MYTVRNPFYSRKGQFSEGQDLCVGIAINALESKGDKSFSLKIGKNPMIYSQNATLLLKFIERKKSFYTSKQSGIKVGIIPVDKFITSDEMRAFKEGLHEPTTADEYNPQSDIEAQDSWKEEVIYLRDPGDENE